MPRDVDEKKTRKALRKLRKTAERAKAEGIELTEWEQEFLDGVDERLNTYGSAFNDLSKGQADEALSAAQARILRELDKKSRGKATGGFKTRKPLKAGKESVPKPSYARDIHEDVPPPERDHPHPLPEPDLPLPASMMRASDVAPTRPSLKVVGGKKGSQPEKTPDKAPEKAQPSRSNAHPFRVIDGGKSD